MDTNSGKLLPKEEVLFHSAERDARVAHERAFHPGHFQYALMAKALMKAFAGYSERDIR